MSGDDRLTVAEACLAQLRQAALIAEAEDSGAAASVIFRSWLVNLKPQATSPGSNS